MFLSDLLTLFSEIIVAYCDNYVQRVKNFVWR